MATCQGSQGNVRKKVYATYLILIPILRGVTDTFSSCFVRFSETLRYVHNFSIGVSTNLSIIFSPNSLSCVSPFHYVFNTFCRNFLPGFLWLKNIFQGFYVFFFFADPAAPARVNFFPPLPMFPHLSLAYGSLTFLIISESQYSSLS